MTPESLTFDKTTLTLQVGGSDAIVATVAPADATDKTVAYSSSDETIVTVDSAGKVTAVKAGTATITGKTINDKSATCEVTVDAAEG